jgi:glycosyltransferase involved in cell wall biosynthesis
LNILQVNYYDNIGGSARIGWYLFNRYRQLGHNSYLAAGLKTCQNAHVLEIPNDNYRNLWANFWNKAEKAFNLQWKLRLLPGCARLMAALGEPYRWKERQKGIEDFHFPATRCLLDLTPERPQILHAHNLHGNYFFFDMTVLPILSHSVPTIVTLHDEWMMTGHCVYTLGCERWRIGCGRCPDLTIYPAIKRDATDFNSLRKREIYKKSRLYVATPSKWLMDRARESILSPAIVDARVIHNGVDLGIFQPKDRLWARQSLELPANAWIVIFVGHFTHSNRFKDYQTVKDAFLRFSARSTSQESILLCVGEEGEDHHFGSALIRFVGYTKDMQELAKYYCAADVLTHAAHTDNFPNTVIEALACGTPVIGTAVGGVPEQIEEGVTGFLVPAADSEAMSVRITDLHRDRNLWQRMGHNAAEIARKRFSIERMGDEYLAWYHEILQGEGGEGY